MASNPAEVSTRESAPLAALFPQTSSGREESRTQRQVLLAFGPDIAARRALKGTHVMCVVADQVYVLLTDGWTSGGWTTSDASGVRESPGEVDLVSSPRELLAEVKRRSGLTWQQIAYMFGVDRRSVHLWSSGGGMTAANEERLHAVSSLLRAVDAGDPLRTRSVLLSRALGKPLIQRIAAGEDEEGIAATARRVRETVSRVAEDQRSPRRRSPSPIDMLDVPSGSDGGPAGTPLPPADLPPLPDAG
jgi:hypothetical protein